MALAIDLYCGLGGWTDGLLAEGYEVIGFDIEAHEYGDHRYPAQLVLQDVLTLHGAQFKDATLIVASPPCQEYSYMAMPWTRAKQIAAALRGNGDFPEGYTGSRTIEELNRLFDACIRIQREACEAAGRHIPLVVENVRGAIPWVGRSRWNFGSFHLWGDVPALMPPVFRYGAQPGNKRTNRTMCFPAGSSCPEKVKGRTGKLHWQDEAIKNAGHLNKRDGHSHTRHLTNPSEHGAKQPGIGGLRANGKGDAWFQDGAARHGSKSQSRKAASALDRLSQPVPDAENAGLAYALQDSENTCKMGDLSEDDQKRYFARAAKIARWLAVYGYEVVKKSQPAPGEDELREIWETCERTFYLRDNKRPPQLLRELSEVLPETLAEGWQPWGLSEIKVGIGADMKFGYIVYFKRRLSAPAGDGREDEQKTEK